MAVKNFNDAEINSLTKYYVHDLLKEPEKIIDVEQEEVHKIWPEGFFEYTDTLYNRKGLLVTPSDIKTHGSLKKSKTAYHGNEIPQHRAYFEAGTQLLPYADCIKGKNILDIGCGYGDYSFAMEQMGAASVTAVDVHQENIDMCGKIKQNFKSNIKLETRDVNDLTREYLSKFDTVVAFQCLSWTNCHVEFFKNVNKAGVRDLIMTEQLRGLPVPECVEDKSFCVREPMLVLNRAQGYHYGGTGWEDSKTCLRAETNLSFWREALDYYGWYIKDWSWQKNCTINGKTKAHLGYARRFVFHCISTTNV